MPKSSRWPTAQAEPNPSPTQEPARDEITSPVAVSPADPSDAGVSPQPPAGSVDADTLPPPDPLDVPVPTVRGGDGSSGQGASESGVKVEKLANGTIRKTNVAVDPMLDNMNVPRSAFGAPKLEEKLGVTKGSTTIRKTY